MMLNSSQLFGLLLIVVALMVFVYYTSWTIMLPLGVFDGFPNLKNIFPPREYAIAIPAAILATVVSMIVIFISLISWRQARKRKTN